ncbi:hypothetical protein OBBRIDRAFT_736426, partial [Obba rivulosa]
RQKTQQAFGHLPCLWQAKVAQDILKGDKNVIYVALTGLEKTFTFWMPLPFCIICTRSERIKIICCQNGIAL